ncbi:substrate-binding domain-containing protein [Ruminococcus sp.]|uniref:substrate-binding domain-containing protein n=1 Tax=Ruminococcus sp. TaxID=41978 RepID=UPI0025D19C1B|nr:substrate-binding domain-containing protein [Ruminococcus sp.]MCR4640244.1 substrate-binding domain-containing protein [Ruminococcus sp.]
MRKRIAFITVNAEKLYQTSLIEAMAQQSAALGYDLVVLTHFVNYDNETDHLKGDENIYTLIRQLSFDGAVFDSGSFYSRSLSKKLEDMLWEKGIPVIALDYLSDRFESCLQNNRENFRKLTEHFIKVHGFRKIYCLSGPEGIIHSDQRIEGYRDALEENGLPFRQDYVFYGDFWVNYANDFGARIAEGKIERPEAIVCGNDYMALQLCLSLAENGINVPDDIAVGGYDGNPDVSSYQPSLTTFGNAFLENGIEAICRLHRLISGEAPTQRIEVRPAVKTGASCGCKADTSGDAAISEKMFARDMSMSIFMHSNYSSMMNNVKNMDECAIVLAQNAYLLDPRSDFFLLLCEGDDSANSGYTKEMRCRIAYCRGMSDITPRRFTLDRLIPPQELSDEPAAYIFTPLHYLDRNFGCCVRRCTGAVIFEQYYGEFCQVAANSIERIRMLDYERSLNEKIQRLSERDILTGLFSRKGLISRTDTLSTDRPYYGVIYCIEDAEQLRGQYGSEHVRQIIVTFAQAVNLSCARDELAARTGSDEFIIIGECDGSEFPEQLFVNLLRSNLKMTEVQQNVSISAKLRRLSAVTQSGTAPTDMIAQLEERLEAARSSSDGSSSAYLAKIRELRCHVYEEPQLEWTADNASAKIGISTSYFQHLYRQFLNISFNADVISARLALAERLLTSTALSIGEIAEKCGYPDASHFMKLFRRKKGMTASEYRKDKKQA